MKAAVFYEAHQPVPVENVDLDGPQKGEVRVKMAGAGACHSDYHAVTGHSVRDDGAPFVMGHEGAGVVEEVGDGVDDLALGDHVIFSLTRQCGLCRNCTAGRANLCEVDRRSATEGGYRFSKDGIPLQHGLATFSEETVVSASSLVKVRKDIPVDKLCLFGCSVMTGVGAVVNRAKAQPGSTIAIFGCGGVGLHAVQGARLVSASKIIAIDKMDSRLDAAKELGATHTINPDREDPVGRIMDMTGGGVDYAFEVVGLPELVTQAYDCTRPGGTACMVGVPPSDSVVSVSANALFMDRTLMGTFYGAGRPRIDFPWLLDLYMDGRIKLDEIITKYRPLAEINEAFDDMVSGAATRTVLTFN